MIFLLQNFSFEFEVKKREIWLIVITYSTPGLPHPGKVLDFVLVSWKVLESP